MHDATIVLIHYFKRSAFWSSLMEMAVFYGNTLIKPVKNVQRKREYSHKGEGGGVWPASQNLYLFMTQNVDFPCCSIYDLTRN